MVYEQAVPTSGGRYTNIWVSKLKIIRPKISFSFFKKIDFGGWTLLRGGGGVGQVKASKGRFA